MYTNKYCYATRLIIGRVLHRHSWYYNVAERSSYRTGEIYTMQRQRHICHQAASSRNVDSPSARYFIDTKKVAQVIIGANVGVTRAQRGSSPSEDKEKIEGQRYHLRIQTDCMERFRRIKPRSLSLTNTSRTIIKSGRITNQLIVFVIN